MADTLRVVKPAAPPPEPVPTAVIEAHDVCFSYTGADAALVDVSLSVDRGQVCMILGPSGSGKSTFLRAVKGQIRPQVGAIRVLGEPAGAPGLASRVAMIPQSLGLVRTMTVLDNTLTGTLGRIGTFRSLVKLFPAVVVRRAHEVLDSLGIAHKVREPVYRLSGGERQRVAIARALMQEPEIILADEFVSQLDLVTTREAMAVVRDIAARGVTFLVTSHEIDLVAEFGDRAVFFRDGRKVHEGRACDVCIASAVGHMSR